MTTSTETSPFEGTTPVPAVHGPRAGVTMISGRSFALSDGDGNMSPSLTQGLFVLDTRVLSSWLLTIDGDVAEPLGVDNPVPYASAFLGRGRPRANHADADVVVVRRRSFGQGMVEHLEVTNHGLEPVELDLRLAVDCDFADLFEVKESRLRHRERDRVVEGSRILFSRTVAGDTRLVEIDLGEQARIEDSVAAWNIALGPRQSWRTRLSVTAWLDGRMVGPFGSAADGPAAVSGTDAATALHIGSDSVELGRTMRRTAEDLAALRIRDDAFPDLPLVAAGAPWFMTLFGRDSLLTSWMAMISDPGLARGVLETLARLQGRKVDHRSGEEPGKILHEVRFSDTDMRTFDDGDIYYGSADATPLFVMMAAELHRWNPSPEFLERLLPHLDRAMDWIENHGDADADGYVEYQRVGDYGLVNQGWKDSWDAIRHADGTLAMGPIALCEVQAYVYGAYLGRAELALAVGDTVRQRECLERAAELHRRFNEDFWVDDEQFYALALDGRKQPVAVPSSNMGHCLWTGIIRPDRAAAVADALMGPGGFSGWGVRTLSAHTRSYNPVSYHNGSVWPHDTAICAWGLSRYGFVEQASRLLTAQLDVADAFDGRLPELFAGFHRDEFGIPAVYPSSCSPQAWAAAAPLLWIRTILGLEPVAAEHRFWLHPELPEGIDRLRVEGIAIAGRRITIDIEYDRVSVSGTGDLAVVPAARPVFDPAAGLRTLLTSMGGDRP